MDIQIHTYPQARGAVRIGALVYLHDQHEHVRDGSVEKYIFNTMCVWTYTDTHTNTYPQARGAARCGSLARPARACSGR